MSLAAETIVRIGGFSLTNAMIASLLVSIFLVLITYLFSKNVALVPGKFQNLLEFAVEFMYKTAKEVVGEEEKTKAFFPLIATFFLFILVANWSGLLPFFNTIGFHTKEGFVPLLRPMNTDLNATVALAIVSAIATQYFAVKYVGVKKHLGRYFSLNPLNLYIGLLELVSEFTKIISLSFRLYGNIIAGDLVIGTFTSMIGILVPLPFMGLEIIVGFVQAAVFAMLSLAFTNVLTEKLH